ncbi:MAG: hypothetical protein NVSMB4_05060 [Acidimicrobiales bacterium]
MALVNGSRDCAELAARLKAEGDVLLRRQLLAGLRAGAKPLVPKVQAAAREKLPRRGGLADQVAGQPVSVTTRFSARSFNIRLSEKRLTSSGKRTGAKGADNGTIRHPVFGHWLAGQPDQQIPRAAGWWSDTLRRASPEVTDDLYRAAELVAQRVQGRG